MKLTSALLLVLSLSAFSSFAQGINYTFYFQTDSGDEIGVNVSGTKTSPRYIFRNNKGYVGTELFYQYIKSTLEQRNYVYIGDKGSNNITKLVDSGVSSPANQLIEAAALRVGARDVERIYEYVTALIKEDDNGQTKSPFIVVTSSAGIPIGVCRIDQITCQQLEGVAFTGLKGGFSVNHPPLRFEDRNSFDIHMALHDFITTIEAECKTTFSGLDNNLKAETVCQSKN